MSTSAVLQRRLWRDRAFRGALAVAAVSSAAALLAVVAFLLAGALPLLDWRGPGLKQLGTRSLDARPRHLSVGRPTASTPLLDLLLARPGVPQCAEVGGRMGCYRSTVARPDLAANGTGAQIEFTLQRCAGCTIAAQDRAVAEVRPGQVAVLLSDKRSLLLADSAASLSLLRPHRDQLGQLQLQVEPSWTLPGAALIALHRIGDADRLLAIDADGALSLIDASQRRWHDLAELQVDTRNDALFAAEEQIFHWRQGELRHYRLSRLDTPPLLDLWQPLQVAGQSKPAALWQPHSDDGAGTPRLNLWPLLLGSLKAALLGLLFGAPLAVAAAMHSVQYRSGLWRDGIKSSFELMEAVPTVILGLIAGLWVAPWLDQHLGAALGAVLGWLLLMVLPGGDRHSELSDRNRAAHSLVRCALGLMLGGWLGSTLESQLPGGRLTAWMHSTWGWSYEPYNAVVVGLLVGLAIAPMIYSLSEEALRRAPAGLQEAALALGASRRDTLFGLLLPTALPGIIAACLLGFGRALGETLIVLLASNNAPIADLNPLSGLRSITTTLVLEAPTAVPGSVHYRVLLLATLLLMATTIGLNLLANRWRARMARRPPRLRLHVGRKQ